MNLNKLTVSINSKHFANKLYKKIKRYGVVIIENVFTEDECNNYTTDILTCFDALKSDLDIKDLSTWKDENLPPQTRPGMFQSLVGNLPPVWKIRTHNNVQKIFETVYSKLRGKNITNFIVSSDGINIKPVNKSPFHTNKTKDWPHIDQTYGDAYKCIQGQAVFTNTTACFRASIKSHLIFDKILETLKINNKSNWLKLNENDFNIVKNIVTNKKIYWQEPIYAKKGSFIIWTSSTIHSAQYAIKNEIINNKDKYNGWRSVVYVCYRPREEFTVNEIKKRQNIYYNNRMSNHWSTKIFAKQPNAMYINISSFHPNIQNYITAGSLLNDTL